jgi:hypothetical protein
MVAAADPAYLRHVTIKRHVLSAMQYAEAYGVLMSPNEKAVISTVLKWAYSDLRRHIEPGSEK